MPAPGVDPLYDMYVKAFGPADRGERPPRHYLDVLLVYAGNADLFTSRAGSGLHRATWLDGDLLGTLSVMGVEDGAVITGSLRSLGNIREIELSADTYDDGLKLVGVPAVTVHFGDGDPIDVAPRDRNGAEFIAELLARMKKAHNG